MSRPMTERAAFKEAQRRWGKNAAIERKTQGHLAGQHFVGRIALGCMFMVEGMGLTWEAAFEAATAKAART